MKAVGLVIAVGMMLTGCASDERFASQNDPYENLPLARPAPIPVYAPSKDYNNQSAPLYVIYPKGDSYPENGP